MVMPADKVGDIIRRTKANYDFVKGHKECGLFEVTQLVNSFLCAVIQPWDKFDTCSPPWNMPLVKAKAAGWPSIAHELSTPKQLHELIKNMRDALAHGNVEYLASNDRRDISGLRLTANKWDRPSKAWTPTWRGEFTIGELEAFFCKFVETAAGSSPKTTA